MAFKALLKTMKTLCPEEYEDTFSKITIEDRIDVMIGFEVCNETTLYKGTQSEIRGFDKVNFLKPLLIK